MVYKQWYYIYYYT